MSDIDDILKRISSHKGVTGLLVINSEGIPVRTTMDNSTTVQYAQQVSQFSALARSAVRDLDPTNDLTFLRIRSKKHEILISPERGYMLVVIQDPSE